MELLTGLRSNLFISALVLALSSLLFAQTATPATASASQPATASSAPARGDTKWGKAKPADASDADDPVATIKTQVREVNVIFTVTDKHGRFKKDLKQED